MRRRSFLKNVAASSAGVTLLYQETAKATEANNRIRIGLIGCGGRGFFVGERIRKVENVEIAAVCDIYERKRLRAKQWSGGTCTAHADFREILDRKDIDAVVVATPDHWHAIPTVMACEAGKDVYVEKPLAHNIREGRAMIDAARRHHRIVQTGTQQRSAQHFETIRQIISGGKIGNVRYVRIWNFKNSTPGRRRGNTSPTAPSGFDWHFFVGPAPLVPYDGNRYSNFRRFWDYAGGIATNYGTHRFDSVRHAMSLDKQSPRTVSAVGQRFELDQRFGEDPDVVQMTFEYDDLVISYEGIMMNALGLGFRTPDRPYYRMLGKRDRPHGMAFYGTKGTIFADRLGFELYPELKPGKRTDRIPSEEVTGDFYRTESAEGQSPDSTLLHVQNFIQSVRSRERPIADVEVGHGSSILPHLGNIAARVGHKLVWDADREEITNSKEAAALLGRVAREPWDLI